MPGLIYVVGVFSPMITIFQILRNQSVVPDVHIANSPPLRNRNVASNTVVTSDHPHLSKEANSWLCYCASFGISFVIYNLPFVITCMQFLHIPKYFYLVFIIWLMSLGADVMGNFLSGLLITRLFCLSNQVEISCSRWLHVLRYTGLPANYERFIRATLNAGLVLLFSLIFFFTPGFITSYGCLLIGIVYPALVSYNVSVQRNLSDGRLWLTYWIVYTVFTLLLNLLSPLTNWIPLFNHVKLIAILWLQLPFFLGADKIFSRFSRYLIYVRHVSVAGSDTRTSSILPPTLLANNNDDTNDVPVAEVRSPCDRDADVTSCSITSETSQIHSQIRRRVVGSNVTSSEADMTLMT